MDLLLHLRAFCAVVEQQSFTGAAAELGVPQPVVSRRVAALEKHLGGRLVVRDPRGATTNELGDLVLPLAQDLRARAEHLEAVARSARSELVVWLPESTSARALVPVRGAAHRLGMRLGLATAPSDDRLAALSGPAAALALVGCLGEEADVVDDLGAGTRDASARPIHLDALRARRDDHGRPRCLHLGREEDTPWVRDVVRRSAARAGLAPHQLVVGSSPLGAAADVVEHDDVWLCTRGEARAHHLAWQPFADLDVRRHHRLAASRAGAVETTAAQRAALVDVLAEALGLTRVGTGPA